MSVGMQVQYAYMTRFRSAANCGCHVDKIANTYDEEVDNAVSALTSMIEPLMIVGLAVIVGGIVVALFAPLVKIIEKMS